MWVIKLGGSLQDSEYLQPWLEAIADHGSGRAVVVPGGGRFADAVREAQRRFGFDDAEAHRAAVRAMEDSARLLHEHAPQLIPVQNRDEILSVLEQGGVPLWLPCEMIIGNPQVPENWHVTADSLALWLAQHLAAHGLVLVKSVSVDEMQPLDELAAAGVIDAFFPELFQKQAVNLTFRTGGQHRQLLDLLEYGLPRVALQSAPVAASTIDTSGD